mmetsp:Transcript_6775/g.15562  ORF Transcript_6775/g.15562 Transcript_6775/m.15562 type:complete len:206 (+) Transcript_6775:146-763(+)
MPFNPAAPTFDPSTPAFVPSPSPPAPAPQAAAHHQRQQPPQGTAGRGGRQGGWMGAPSNAMRGYAAAAREQGSSWFGHQAARQAPAAPPAHVRQPHSTPPVHAPIKQQALPAAQARSTAKPPPVEQPPPAVQPVVKPVPPAQAEGGKPPPADRPPPAVPPAVQPAQGEGGAKKKKKKKAKVKKDVPMGNHSEDRVEDLQLSSDED